MDQATWLARRAANRDPAVGIVARSARRVTSADGGGAEGAVRVTASTGASSEFAARRSPQRAPALGRSGSGSGPPRVVSTLQAQSTKQQAPASGSTH
jgi:hypothetical protein